MTSNEIKQKLARLGLKKTGDKATLESFLTLAEKMGIPSNTKVVEIHAELPEDTQLEIRSITEISRLFPVINSKGDLEAAVELRYNRITLAKGMISRLLKIDEQDIELQLKKNSFNRTKQFMERLLEPLNHADKLIEQRMIEYDQANQIQQDMNRNKLINMIAEQSKKDIIEKAEQLIEDGKEIEAAELLTTLDDSNKSNDELNIYLPEVKKSKTKVEGASFTSRFTWEVKDIEKVKVEYLQPPAENRGLIRKVVTEKGIAAEEIIGGIKVTEKSGVRKGRQSEYKSDYEEQLIEEIFGNNAKTVIDWDCNE